MDDFTRTTWVYLLHAKHEVFSMFQLLHKIVDTQFDSKIRILRSNNGGEYIRSVFSTYLSQHDILHQTTYPRTPEQNGIAKQKNRHLLEITRAFFTMHVPQIFWINAL